MYWMIAKTSPGVRPLPRSMRAPLSQTITRAAALSTKAAIGSMIAMRTFARMMLSAMTRVASVIRLWAKRSRSKARMTRMPRRRSRTRSFCLSQ